MGETQELIQRLNQALAWELRAQAMYAHYATYVRGIHRLHLKPFFEAEAAESVAHATTVRQAIASLGGVAVTERAEAPIAHTTDYRQMLEEALKTEKQSVAAYQAILPLLREHEEELYDAIEQILFAEERSREELIQLT
ncbi:MAG: ferritin-like domain-containing protein [Gammaproteobacteria bacterium]